MAPAKGKVLDAMVQAATPMETGTPLVSTSNTAERARACATIS